VHGRQLLVERVLELGWTVPMAAEAQGCSAATGYKWVRRFRAEGVAGLSDRSSRPHHSPARLSPAREAAIVRRRQQTLQGPHRIAWALGEAPSTVHRVLRRHGAPRLRDLDRPTRTVVRYERDRPGELVHVDVKKLGKIPPGGGWRGRGELVANHKADHSRVGWDYVHSMVDDHSRLAYSEILDDERGTTCASFVLRAAAFFRSMGIERIEELMSDNAKNYTLSGDFQAALVQLGARHVLIRPHCPWQNGKVERLNRTLQVEWAYRRIYTSNAQRRRTLATWLRRYNTKRPHGSLGGRPPVSRLS